MSRSKPPFAGYAHKVASTRPRTSRILRSTEKTVSELTHDKLILKEALDGKILSLPAAGVC